MPPLPQSLLIKTALRNPRQKPESKSGVRETALIKEDQVREYLSKPDTHTSMDCDGMHPLKLMKVTDAIASQY